jgi:hypothetical protein
MWLSLLSRGLQRLWSGSGLNECWCLWCMVPNVVALEDELIFTVLLQKPSSCTNDIGDNSARTTKLGLFNWRPTGDCWSGVVVDEVGAARRRRGSIWGTAGDCQSGVTIDEVGAARSRRCAWRSSSSSDCSSISGDSSISLSDSLRLRSSEVMCC